MPAFSFEKISVQVRLAPNKPTPAIQRRGMISSLIERMAKARSKKSDRQFVRFESSSRNDSK